jgi:hypothetical protein
MKNYNVRIGFGLHLGWSIEGPIGSHFKIDASYISPNVLLATKFEEKTKEYGVLFIFSSEVKEYMSKEAQEYCRIIDSVFDEDGNLKHSKLNK